MHIPAGQMIKHWRMARCFKNTEMRLGWKDVEVASWCMMMGFNMTGKDGVEKIELVALFAYLGGRWTIQTMTGQNSEETSERRGRSGEY